MSDSHYRVEFNQAVQQFEHHKAKHRERMAVLQEQLPAIAVNAASANGAATVTVNAEGVLTGLRLSDAVVDMSPSEITDAVLQAYGSAQREAARKSAELITPVVGDEGYLQDRLRWRQEFEPIVTNEPFSVDSSASADDEDDDFDPGTIYRA